MAFAPIFGFAGVAIGALLKDKSDRRLALRQDRREVYREFLRALFELQKLLLLDQPGEYNDEEIEEHQGQLRRSIITNIITLNTLYVEVDLIGSPKIAVIASGVAAVCEEASNYALADDKYDTQKLNNLVIKLVTNFRDAALQDLGVPRRERNRRAEEIFTRAELTKIMDELGIHATKK